MMEYTEVYRKLLEETAVVTFLKKDGKIRNMLATRNMKTVRLDSEQNERSLDWHDRKCGIRNGNIAVMDLIIGEGRCFNIDRIISIQYVGVISTREELDKTVKQFIEFDEQYKKENVMELTMTTFDA